MTAYLGGPVTAMGMGGTASAHLAAIEKLSNGFIIRFQKPQKVTLKTRGLEALGLNLDEEARGVLQAGLEAMKEGESWKDIDPALKAVVSKGPTERWILVPMAVACKTEEELLVAIREAVAAHSEIEKLTLEGELI